MGTRKYADAVANAIDPDGKFFGGRILSRDENSSKSYCLPKGYQLDVDWGIHILIELSLCFVTSY